MLALLCSAPRIDEYDPYPPSPTSPSRTRRASRSLSFIKSPGSPSSKKRRVSKMTIGTPEAFRHEFHMGKDMATTNTRLDLWDSTRWQQEITYHEKLPTNSTSTPSITPSASSVPSMSSRPLSKRNSITPQKRKPVPSIIPDMTDFPSLAPQDVPLPPSPTATDRSEEPAELPKALVPLLDPPRRTASVDESERLYVTQTVKARWDNAMDEIEKALKGDTTAGTQCGSA